MTGLARLCAALARRARDLGGDHGGAILLELAFLLPVSMILLLGCYDVARYVLLNQKLDRASSTMADLVSQPDAFTPDMVTVLFPAAAELLDPFDLALNGRVIISEIEGQSGDVPRIQWQRSGGGGLAASSTLGAENEVADLPPAFTIVREGEKLVSAEVFYSYEPFLLSSLFEARIIAQRSFRRPRQR